MTKLGIIGAMEQEVETLLAAMTDKQAHIHAGSTFFEGTLEGLPAVVVRCGIGKVNAALCAQILCSCYGITHLVNTGIAGSLSNSLDIGDLVISQDAMYHDFDCVHFGYPFGKVPGMEVTAFPADDTLLAYAFAAAEEVNPGHTKIGRIASGDQFVASQEKKDAIISATHGVCTEMEGAAIAHIAAHSTHHSDCIVTEDAAAAKKFTEQVDSAAVYVNVSTRFTDGGEFGLGCEMGISTQKLHARGPMGLRELTTYKYIVTGDGQTR